MCGLSSLPIHLIREMSPLKNNFKRLFSVTFAKKALISILIAFIFQLLFSPVARIVDITFSTAYAKEGTTGQVEATSTTSSIQVKENKDNVNDTETIIEKEKKSDTLQEDRGYLPESKDKDKYKIDHTLYTTITAYNSEISQCWGDPCITATGFNVCEHGIEDTIATNRLSFGTKLRIPQLFGDRVFTVRDRMNKRYHNRMDVWMVSKEDAENFGIKRDIRVQVLKRR